MNQKALILDIAMNLSRIGNWAADDFEVKKKRIKIFLIQTSKYIKSVNSDKLQSPFKSTFDHFVSEFQKLDTLESTDKLLWAEKMMTWGNILTHRSKLLD